ncbi:MAG: hypothetical protein ACLSUW_10675 [Akkermansia sp.]
MNISGILLPVLCAAFIASGFADIPASNVPAPVKAQVQNQFPNAGVIEWDFDHDEDVYEAEFHINGLEYEMKLSARRHRLPHQGGCSPPEPSCSGHGGGR